MKRIKEKIRRELLKWSFLNHPLQITSIYQPIKIVLNQKIIRRNNEFDLDFLKYYYINYQNIEEKIDQIKKGLPEGDQKFVDFYIKLKLELATREIFPKDFKFSINYSREKYIEDLELREKYEKKYEIHFEEGMLYYQYGLKYLDPEDYEKYKNKVILDCGAYLGDSAVLFNELLNPKKIYCFEPNPVNYKKLEENIKKWKINNLIPINYGVGERKKTLKITNNEGSSTLGEEGDFETKITTIDDFLEENGITDIGVIKMDIEGYELEAIKGAEKTIKKYKPLLLICIYHTGKDFFEIKPLLEKWNPNYKFRIVPTRISTNEYETILIAY